MKKVSNSVAESLLYHEIAGYCEDNESNRKKYQIIFNKEYYDLEHRYKLIYCSNDELLDEFIKHFEIMRYNDEWEY